MAYTVLARKYRPQSFEDLVGQEHVARTLANAINADRVAHAFLTPTPCNECGPCLEITAGIDVDVQEIDGASNNSVEDVRRLQESLPYRPQRDRYKIVIVDEVHMLSAGAFNAFLKTLEEPPDHVKFIFATTEGHKVPVTIRSRCQQYDFRLIPHRLIADRVRAILDAETLSADEEAISVVSREAAGSMRDALTLLDQLVAISGDRITADTVAASLGIAAREALYDVARAVLEGDGAGVVGAIDGLADKSVDMQHFARQLLQLVRDLVVLKLDAGDPAEWVPEERQAAEALIGDIDILELQRAFRATSMVMDEMAHSPNPKLMLEMGLVRVATRPPLQAVSDLVARLESLQADPGAAGGSSGGTRPRKPKPAPRPAKPKAEAKPEAKAAPKAEPEAKPEPEPDPKPQDPDQPIMPATKHSGGFHTSSGEVLTPIRRAALQEWEELVGTLEQQQPALAAVLEHGIPKAVGPDRIVLSFKNGSFYGRQAESPESIAAIVRIAEQQLGARPEVEIRFDAQAEAATKTVAAVAAQRKQAEAEATRKEALNHPIVRDAVEVFPESAGKLKVHIEAD
ncbi:MAG: DNA polymerase III subunit gamma/tau [Deltaproteobacteria bacterium]|nr:DNA polymerase III subunit gamma/tau [Deltaproteobacteria bacterium]